MTPDVVAIASRSAPTYRTRPGGRDKSTLVEGVLWQVECVREEVPDVPVRGILCFVDSEWPLLAGPFRVSGVEVLWPRKLVGRLTAAGPDLVGAPEVAERLAQRFRSA